MKITALMTLLSLALGAAACADDVDALDVPADNLTDRPLDDVADGKADGVTIPVVPADPPVRYPTERTYSPITPGVARNLLRIAERGDDLEDNVFAKVGDSITVAPAFLNCFAGANVDLGARPELAETVARFNSENEAGIQPWKRASVAAKGGWMSHQVMSGSPSKLAQEVERVKPRYAVVMFGTNDAASRVLGRFAPTMLDLVDKLTRRGVIPILSTAPPNRKSPATNREIPIYNAVIRGIAQGRQIPLVDFNRELQPLERQGLSPDGVHPRAFSGGACKLTAEGLEHGYNVRNLISLTALDRTRRVVEGDAAPDADAGPLFAEGDGSVAAPFAVAGFPLTDLRSTTDGASQVPSYGCGPQNEGGPEILYTFTLDRPAHLRAAVFDRGTTDVDLHLLRAGEGGACLRRADTELSADLAAGTYVLAVDSFQSADGTVRSGEYLLVATVE